MINLTTVEIVNLFFYQAPTGITARPRQIPPCHKEIEVIISGYGDFQIENKSVRVGPGQGVWLDAGEWVEVTSDTVEPYQAIVFVFKVEGRQPPPGRQFMEWESPASCSGFCCTALDSFNSKSYNEDFSQCLYARLIWELEYSKRRQAMREMPIALEKALNYIRKHFTEPVTIADIAEAGGVSASHLHAICRHHTGETPLQYMLKLRIIEVCRLLSETDLPIKQICEKCGFNDLKNFYLYFKRHQQLTPGQYRRLTAIRTKESEVISKTEAKTRNPHNK